MARCSSPRPPTECSDHRWVGVGRSSDCPPRAPVEAAATAARTVPTARIRHPAPQQRHTTSFRPASRWQVAAQPVPFGTKSWTTRVNPMPPSHHLPKPDAVPTAWVHPTIAIIISIIIILIISSSSHTIIFTIRTSCSSSTPVAVSPDRQWA